MLPETAISADQNLESLLLLRSHESLALVAPRPRRHWISPLNIRWQSLLYARLQPSHEPVPRARRSPFGNNPHQHALRSPGSPRTRIYGGQPARRGDRRKTCQALPALEDAVPCCRHVRHLRHPDSTENESCVGSVDQPGNTLEIIALHKCVFGTLNRNWPSHECPLWVLDSTDRKLILARDRCCRPRSGPSEPWLKQPKICRSRLEVVV